jgi:hypothetical protein
MTTSTLEIGDLFSVLGAHGIERQLQRVGGVGRVSVNPVSGSTTVVYDPGRPACLQYGPRSKIAAFIVRARPCPDMFAMATRCRAILAQRHRSARLTLRTPRRMWGMLGLHRPM